MTQMVGRAWEDEVLERGINQGRLLTLRGTLRALLEERFGRLPDALIQHIEQTQDIDRLQACFKQGVHITKLDDLTL